MKKISFVRHATDYQTVPMLIFHDDGLLIANQIWKTSTSVAGIPPNFTIELAELATLDPGGMYFAKIPEIEFVVDDYLFKIQLTKIDMVLSCLEKAQHRIPGFQRFPLWITNWIMPTSLYFKLHQKLEFLQKSDETLHAQISEDEIKEDLEQSGFFRRNIKREDDS